MSVVFHSKEAHAIAAAKRKAVEPLLLNAQNMNGTICQVCAYS
jgi:hypothetical protein